jgi:predicted PurR-regulated permease PerM
MVFLPRDPLRGSELRLFAEKIAVVVAFALALLVLWAARGVLVLIFIAAVVAAGISPAVQRVRVTVRHLLHRNLPRGAAVLLVYFPFVLVAGTLIAVMVPRLIAESHALGAQLPALLERNIFTPLEHYFPMQNARAWMQRGVSLPHASVFGYVRGAATAVASLIAVLFMAVYMLIDAPRLRNTLLLLYPPEARADRRRTMVRIGRRMSSWLSGQLILSAIIGITTFAVLLILRLPYALPLALFATFGEMVPVIGPILGFMPALAIALLHSRWQFWSVLAAAIVMQKLENFIIAPRVMSRRVSISPLAAFIAFMMGAAILGIAGALMAIPIAAIVQVAFEEIFVSRRERRHDVDRAGTLFLRRD